VGSDGRGCRRNGAPRVSSGFIIGTSLKVVCCPNPVFDVDHTADREGKMIWHFGLLMENGKRREKWEMERYIDILVSAARFAHHLHHQEQIVTPEN
jgi:hypothetical protein